MHTARGFIRKKDNDFIVWFTYDDGSQGSLRITVATSDQSIWGSNATLTYEGDDDDQLKGIRKWSGFIDENEIWIDLGRSVYMEVPGPFETAGSLPALISGTAK